MAQKAKVLYLQNALEEERCQVLQIDGRLDEILDTASYFVDRSQDILEVLTSRITRVEDDTEVPAELLVKDKQALKRDHDLIEFAVNTAEDFQKTVKKTKGACAEFFRRALVTYNRCQAEAEQRLYEFPDHDAFAEMLQKRQQDEEAKVQCIRAIDEQILRNEIGHTAISIQLLEEQVRLNTARVEAIRNQAENFELNIQFLEPHSFEGLAAEAAAWRKFLENQAGPSS